MTVKKRVYEMLEARKGESLSGEQIANALGVSRNAVWRAVAALREEGFVIDAATNKGYCFSADADILYADGITPFLTVSGIEGQITIYSETESTNTLLKKRALEGAPHGTVVIADSQSGGRGRLGRSFYCPPSSGLYLSVLLKPDKLNFKTPTAITAYTALCVCDAVSCVCGIELSIKWVNDLFLGGKKVAGILTEGVTEYESGQVSSVIVGIGINVSTPENAFPEELRHIAGSLYPDGKTSIKRNRLAAEILNRLCSSRLPSEAELFAEYKSKLFMLGQQVRVLAPQGDYTAEAVDITPTGYLVVRTEKGERVILTAGEIRLLQAEAE